MKHTHLWEENCTHLSLITTLNSMFNVILILATQNVLQKDMRLFEKSENKCSKSVLLDAHS